MSNIHLAPKRAVEMQASRVADINERFKREFASTSTSDPYPDTFTRFNEPLNDRFDSPDRQTGQAREGMSSGPWVGCLHSTEIQCGNLQIAGLQFQRCRRLITGNHKRNFRNRM